MCVFFLRTQTHCLLDPATVEAASDLDDDDEVWEDESSDSDEEFVRKIFPIGWRRGFASSFHLVYNHTPLDKNTTLLVWDYYNDVDHGFGPVYTALCIFPDFNASTNWWGDQVYQWIVDEIKVHFFHCAFAY